MRVAWVDVSSVKEKKARDSVKKKLDLKNVFRVSWKYLCRSSLKLLEFRSQSVGSNKRFSLFFLKFLNVRERAENNFRSSPMVFGKSRDQATLFEKKKIEKSEQTK